MSHYIVNTSEKVMFVSPSNHLLHLSENVSWCPAQVRHRTLAAQVCLRQEEMHPDGVTFATHPWWHLLSPAIALATHPWWHLLSPAIALATHPWWHLLSPATITVLTIGYTNVHCVACMSQNYIPEIALEIIFKRRI